MIEETSKHVRREEFIIKRLDIKDERTVTEVLRIQIPSYLAEAKVIGYYNLPPLKDTIQSLQQCEETFFAYYLQEELCGIISFKLERTEIDLHRLIVHPCHFRKGIAQKLLDFVENMYEVKSIRVMTGSKNTPAINFYIKNDFYKIREVKIDEYLTLSYFRKYMI
ncbi:GNAT family N-acetyltransferase [Priestia endophytica]|uniref:GNAT family N-acetyltransferase n=1 Tax=Priestia endophytica TaxID=135735 RepID=UPI00288964EB|nr:GNAT family N-acetyltransferase [Priestia endophytica]